MSFNSAQQYVTPSIEFPTLKHSLVKFFNRSFIVYLNELRIEKAKQMLEDAMRNIKDISSEVGYRDANYFAKVFKRITGVTPSDYRGMALQKKKKQSAEEE